MLMMRSTNANAKARLSSRAERQRVRIAGETQSYSLEAVAISSRFEEASKVASVLQPPDLPPKGWVAILVLSGKLIMFTFSIRSNHHAFSRLLIMFTPFAFSIRSNLVH